MLVLLVTAVLVASGIVVTAVLIYAQNSMRMIRKELRITQAESRAAWRALGNTEGYLSSAATVLSGPEKVAIEVALREINQFTQQQKGTEL